MPPAPVPIGRAAIARPGRDLTIVTWGAALHEALASTQDALAQVRGSGLLGRPVGAVADSLHGAVTDLTVLADDPLTMDPATISTNLVEATILGGTLTYHR